MLRRADCTVAVSRPLRLLLGLSLLVGAVAVPLATPAAGLTPLFQMPFPCNDPWYGATYTSPKPHDFPLDTSNSIDWNLAVEDRGRPVLAGVGGMLTVGYQFPGYGNYVDIEVGGGWVTRYAHLDKPSRGNGRVEPLDQIGTVGSTGTDASHLHYEQRLNGKPQPAVFNSIPFHYTNFNLPSYQGEENTSRNCAGSPAPGGWYIAPSPEDGSLISGPLRLGVQGKDNGNGGLSRINITVFDPTEQRWKIAREQTFGAGVLDAQVFTDYATVPGKVYLFSFDVYSANGRYQLSPNGVRQACTSSACFPYASSSATVTGGMGSGGCLPNPQVDASIAGLSGDDGWLRSNATVTLSGFDANGCGKAVSVEFSLDGGGWTAYSSATAVNGDGTHVLRYRAASNGTTGVEREATIKIDTVPPSIANPTITAPIDINGIIRDEATISTPWQDATSGVRWVRRRCGSDPYVQSAGGNASWLLAGVGVTACDSYARDIAGWESPVWNSGPLVFNRYTVDASGKLTIDLGTGVTVDGMTRAGSLQVNYNTNTIVNSPIWLTSPGTVTSTGNTSTSFRTVAAPTPVPRLNYPFEFYRARSIVLQGPLVIDNVETPLPAICLYVNGDITIRAVKLNSKACLIATGNIYDQSTASTFLSGDPANGMLMMAGGSVTIGSTGNQNTGMVYAPNGTINVNGATGLDSRGSLVAKDVVLRGVTNSRFSYLPAFAAATYPLPLPSPFIPVATVPPAGAAPSVPVLSSPSNGKTGVGSSTCLTWTGDGQAYEFQLAKSAGFEAASMVRQESAVNTYACAKPLPSATKLYWRVRAVSVGGASSAWSTVRSFTTQ